MKKSFLTELALLFIGVTVLSSCDSDGLTEGDPNYWTTSRGQFTANLEDGSTMYFLDQKDGTACVTFNGAYPLHMTDESSATVGDAITYVGDIVVPSSVVYNGSTMSVTAIGQEAFCGSTALTSVFIPSSITSIEEGAFVLCKAMTAVSFADDSALQTIGVAAFGQCTSLTEITLPASVRTIEKQAFINCTHLASVNLNEGLETIGNQALFDINSSMLSITFPSTVKSIGANVLGGKSTDYSKSLTEVHCKAATPPTLAGALVANPANAVTVYVPVGSKQAYEQADNWKDYTIVEE